MAQPYIGEIRMFAGTFNPLGWEFCNGQEIPISENEALFALIGTTYGGNGEDKFALPNLQSRIPMHFGQGPDGVNYPLAQMAGTEQETLTIQQIPVHTHALLASTAVAQNPDPAAHVVAQSTAGFLYIEDVPDVQFNINAATPVGGSQPHDNTQPFLCINYIISLFGIFPSPS
ncbi:MAG TPA: tail fiber protein [Pyrinomonadaceae bacterium]|nr:tail fiber protein [Pyrinomonadaceae bacterium]